MRAKTRHGGNAMAEDPYSKLADLYDSYAGFRDIQKLYAEWRHHLLNAIRQYRIPVRVFVDLACGTGNSTIPWLKQKGWTVIGVDRSRSMLREARKKTGKVRWICQDLRELNLETKADVATCHFDAINHILNARELQKVFRGISGIMNRGGLFQFDLSTDFFFRWLNGRDKLFRVGKNYFMASNAYESKKRIVTFYQYWFVRDGNVYKKRRIRVQEAAYTQTQIRDMLKKARFRIVKRVPAIKIEKMTARHLYLVQRI